MTKSNGNSFLSAPCLIKTKNIELISNYALHNRSQQTTEPIISNIFNANDSNDDVYDDFYLHVQSNGKTLNTEDFVDNGNARSRDEDALYYDRLLGMDDTERSGRRSSNVEFVAGEEEGDDASEMESQANSRRTKRRSHSDLKATANKGWCTYLNSPA
jgi:hypothetical protein